MAKGKTKAEGPQDVDKDLEQEDLRDETPPEGSGRGEGEDQSPSREAVESLQRELEAARERIRALRRFERYAKRLERQLEEAGVDPDAVSGLAKEVEQLKEELATYQQREAALAQELMEAHVKAAVVAAAARRGFEYPEDVYRVIDLSRIEYDAETGEVKGVDELVEEVAKARPRWLRGSAVGVGQGAVSSQPSEEDLRRELFGGGGGSIWEGGGVFIPE